MSSLSGEPLQDLGLIFECIPDGVFCVDRRMRITFFNRAAEEITGFAREDVLGKPCHHIFRCEVCRYGCPIMEALDSGMPIVNREFDIYPRDRKLALSITASALLDLHGFPEGGVFTFRNITLQPEGKKPVNEKYAFQGIVSRNPEMRRLFDLLPDIAASNATVLITGESGTGKDLFARAIHDLSPRRDHPYVVVNCGALPEPLLEAEIFGTRRGAYTDAVENRSGRLEAAQGGTIFLDEIGDLPLPMQVKLLRVLENHEFQPLGAKHPLKADVRFLTATNSDLEAMVEKGEFRRDLFYRINVLSLDVPPLRQRREDIPLLVDFFLDRFNHQFGKDVHAFSPEICPYILRHDFPGNVRELLNLVEQSVILCRGKFIDSEHLPPGFLPADWRADQVTGGRGRRPPVDMLRKLLDRHHGKSCDVARELGVDRTTVWRWMKQYQL